jgi:hypothetical protein
VAEGYALVHGRALDAGGRAAANRFDLLPNSHDLFPTPRPYSSDPSAPPANVLPEGEWSPGMRNVAGYTRFLATELMGRTICVRIVNLPTGFAACYGPAHGLDFNYGALGRAWFDRITDGTDELLLHEFGHEYASNHLSAEYHRALCRLGAQLKRLALEKPAAFARYTS